MRFRTEFAVWAILLVALAANPVWFFPHAEEPAYEYRAVELTDENRFRHAELHPRVLECYNARSRTCGFGAAVADGGIEVNASGVVYSGGGADYRYVVFSSGFYEPTMQQSGDRVRLTLEPRTLAEVIRNLSYPYAKASDVARTVVREGNATLLREIPDRDRIVRREGTYYALDLVSYRSERHRRFFPGVRWLMWFGTVLLSVAAMWRWC